MNTSPSAQVGSMLENYFYFDPDLNWDSRCSFHASLSLRLSIASILFQTFCSSTCTNEDHQVYWEILFIGHLPSPYEERVMRICMFISSGAVVRHEIWGTVLYWNGRNINLRLVLTFSHSFVFNKLLYYLAPSILLFWVVIRCRGHFAGLLSREPEVLRNVAARSQIQWRWFPESRWSPKSFWRISGCKQLIDTGREPRLSLMHPTVIDQGSDHHVRTSTICLQLASIRDLKR